MIKIGIFGDSYCDLSPKEFIDPSLDRLPWMLWLEKLGNFSVKTFGQAGTNTWTSYKKFLNHVDQFDKVIFLYSNPDRWLNINFDPGVSHIFTEEQLLHVAPKNLELSKLLVSAHPHLYDEQLNLFVYQHIFNSINQICREKDKQLINILTFEERSIDYKLKIDISKSAGPVLTGLHEISCRELIFSNDSNNKGNLIRSYINNNPDFRFCHLNLYNNMLLAKTLVSLIDEPKPYVNLYKELNWSTDIKYFDYILEN